MRARLREFAALVAATARPHLDRRIPDPLLQMASVSLVGAIERVMIELQEGTLDVAIDEVVEFLVQLFVAAGRSAGLRDP